MASQMTSSKRKETTTLVPAGASPRLILCLCGAQPSYRATRGAQRLRERSTAVSVPCARTRYDTAEFIGLLRGKQRSIVYKRLAEEKTLEVTASELKLSVRKAFTLWEDARERFEKYIDYREKIANERIAERPAAKDLRYHALHRPLWNAFLRTESRPVLNYLVIRRGSPTHCRRCMSVILLSDFTG